jgi:hypothetical protein
MSSSTGGRRLRLRAVLLSACALAFGHDLAQAARAPVLMTPATLSADAVVEVTPLTAEAAALNHMQRPLDPSNTVVYDQQFGNSAAAGVLLGPFGVAANIANTKR